MSRSEFTAQLQMTERTEMDKQVEKNRQVRAEVARIRRELEAAKPKWWEGWFAW